MNHSVSSLSVSCSEFPLDREMERKKRGKDREPVLDPNPETETEKRRTFVHSHVDLLVRAVLEPKRKQPQCVLQRVAF